MRTLWAVSAVLLVVAGIWGWRQWQASQEQLALTQLRLAQQVQLNATTQARLASSVLAADSLPALRTAVAELHGRLIAGVRVEVPVHDTTLVHDTLPTTMSPDSTRTAAFRDSTFAGIVQGTVTAPPCCGPLGVHLTVTRPAFAPEVGFVQVGDSMVAVVSWQGQSLRVGSPYVRPLPKRQRALGGFLEALYNPLTGALATRGGAELRTPFATVEAALEQQQGGSPGVWVGLRKAW